MLLSRMWWFGRHIVYDGKENIYTLVKDIVKHKFNPLKEKEGKVCSAARICFSDGKELFKVMKHKHIFFL